MNTQDELEQTIKQQAKEILELRAREELLVSSIAQLYKVNKQRQITFSLEEVNAMFEAIYKEILE